MTQLQMAATAILALFFLAVAGHPGLAATPRNSESATVIAISPMKAAAPIAPAATAARTISMSARRGPANRCNI